MTIEMRASVRDRDLRKAEPEAREAKLRELSRVAHSAPNGELRDMERIIASYEERFGLSSDEMRRRIGAGAMDETRDMLDWLMLLRRRALFTAR